MRTIFITEDAALATAVREQLGQESRRAAAQDQPDQPDQPAQPAFIVGAATFVQDTLARYSEDLGVNYLIARGRIKGITEAQQLASHAASDHPVSLINDLDQLPRFRLALGGTSH